MLSARRLRERSPLFAALVVVVALVSGLGVGLIGYLADTQTSGTRVEIAARVGADRALELSMLRGTDPARQDERVREILSEAFTSGPRAIPLTVDRTVGATAPIPFEADADGSRLRAKILSVPDFADRAELIAGRWPSNDTEVSMQAGTAERLGIEPGASITRDDVSLTVTGTWRVVDPLDPRWLGDEDVVGVASPDGVAAVILDESGWSRLDIDSRARWTLVPTTEQLEAADLRPLISAWNVLPRILRSDPAVEAANVDQRGRLARTAAALQTQLDALGAVVPVVLLTVGTLALVTLLELARLLQGMRAVESRLLWSRGATAPGLGWATAAETAIVTIPAAIVGAAAAVGILISTTGGLEAGLRVTGALLLVPVATAASAIAFMGGSAYLGARRLARYEAPIDSGRAGRIGSSTAVVLLTLAAVICTSQLLLYGSPLAPSRSGGMEVNPLAVSAPALALLSLVLLAVALVPVIGRLLERGTARSAGIRRALVVRTLARRVRVVVTPLVLVSLASGQLVMAATYAATWSSTYTSTQALRAGSELRLLTRETLSIDAVNDIADEPGVADAAPLHVESIVLGAEQVALRGIAPQALGELSTTVPGVFDPVSASAALRTDLPGAALPTGSSSLSLRTEVTGFQPTDLTVLLSEEFGRLAVVTATPTASGYIATLPDPARSWRLDGFEVGIPDDLQRDAEGALPTLRIESIEADGIPVDVEPQWVALSLGILPTLISALDGGPGFSVEPLTARVRLLPQLGEAVDEISPPIVISQRLADRNSLAVGDVVPLTLDSRLTSTPCVVTAIVDAVPGAPEDAAALVDLGVVRALQLRAYTEFALAGEVWIGASDPSSVASALRQELPPAVTVQSRSLDVSRGILGSAAIALGIGAVGAVALAILAVGAVIGVQLASRRGELLILRAVGMGSSDLAGVRRLELGIVLACGLAVGIAAGFVVSLLAVPALAVAAVPNPYLGLRTVVEVDGIAFALGVIGLALLLTGVAAVYGRAVATQARRVTAREDLL